MCESLGKPCVMFLRLNSGKYYRMFCSDQNWELFPIFMLFNIQMKGFSRPPYLYKHIHTMIHTGGLLSYLRGQCKGAVCTGTEAQWCWSEFRDSCFIQAIDTRLLSGFMTCERSHTVPPNQSALTSPHLLNRQR